MANKWLEVQKFGQSLWYDNMSRSFVASGDLQKMIAELGLCGITSNPSIFEKAISTGKEYDADIESSVQQGLSTDETYDRLTTDDIRAAADVLRQVYEDTDFVDGYVSIEVDPRLANDTEKSITQTLDDDRSAKHHDQNSWHACRHPRGPYAFARRDQCKYHVALWP
jgi:transaldolase